MSARPLLRLRRRSGFALWSALAVLLLFFFAATFAFLLIREGDRKVERYRGDRLAQNLAESAAALMIRRFETKGVSGALEPLPLMGGTARGEMTNLPTGGWQVRAVGEVPVPGGESARSIVIIEGDGDPGGGSWHQNSWRYGRGIERR